MELKDVILSTLAEMDENLSELQHKESSKEPEVEQKQDFMPNTVETDLDDDDVTDSVDDESRYLESVKERLLVLFEGFQSPNNVQIEAKIDLTLNFLEYLLATIDTRIEKLKKSRRQ